MNNQKPEGTSYEDDCIEVHSIFLTIQGEGPFAGHPATFVRLAGCNLQCPGCDTEYTDRRKSWTARELATELDSRDGPKLIVITGGEPFRQKLGTFVEYLLCMDFLVQIETNGTLYTELPWSNLNLTIVCSPKTSKLHPKIVPHIDAYKYVLDADHIDDTDGLPTRVLHGEANVARPPFDYRGPIYVQPMDMKEEVENVLNRDFTVWTCLKYGYIFGLQVHKILGLE
jgi:organic radical activating enzyme